MGSKSTSHGLAIVRLLSLGPQYLKSTSFSHDEFLSSMEEGQKSAQRNQRSRAARGGYIVTLDW
jgi:hypothetical protein